MKDYQYHWKLVDKEPVPTTMEEWSDILTSGKHSLWLELVEGVEVSTIFLGINIRLVVNKDGIPKGMFETMVFGGAMDKEQWRWDTYKEAEEGHKSVCELVRKEKEK